VAVPPGLGVPDFASLLVDDRRETGQLVEVGDDAIQHPKHAGTVKRDGTVSGSVSGRRFTTTSSQRSRHSNHSRHRLEDCQLGARGEPEGRRGRGRLPAWFVGSVRPAPLTVATGDLAGVPTGAETRGGRDLTDGQTRLMGFGAGLDPLSLGPFQAFRA